MIHLVLTGLAVIVAMIAVVAVIAAFQPPEFSVARSTQIAAPVPVVFDLVNDFHHWQAWSPYVRLDPAAKNTFDGAPAGQGAIFTWSGNNKIGEGRMTILDGVPSELIRIKLEFMRPFAGTNTAEFTFKSTGGQTAAM